MFRISTLLVSVFKVCQTYVEFREIPTRPMKLSVKYIFFEMFRISRIITRKAELTTNLYCHFKRIVETAQGTSFKSNLFARWDNKMLCVNVTFN